MREIIVLSIGQCGVQVSNAIWELFCLEHGIQCTGELVKDTSNNTITLEEDLRAADVFFNETHKSKYVPRTVMIDLEPTVIDEVRSGPFRGMYHPDQLISAKEDAANNYARGYFTIGKSYIDKTIDQIRKVANNCKALQGFILVSGFGGGTGSGFCSLVAEQLSVEYAKKTKMQFSVLPSPRMSTCVVEPYNTVLSMQAATEFIDVSVSFNNSSVYELCNRKLDMPSPTYTNLNRVIGQVINGATCNFRYDNVLGADLDHIQTNLVPYPRVHFPLVSYAPFTSIGRSKHEQHTVPELVRELFDPQNQMMQCPLEKGKFMSCCMLFRGDLPTQEINKSLNEIKCRMDIRFVDWCPTGFKVGYVAHSNSTVPGSLMAATKRSATMLSTNTAITESWQQIKRQFDIMFAKRPFVHHFVGEGMEEGEFNECKDAIDMLIQDHLECARGTAVEDAENADAGDYDYVSPNTSHAASLKELSAPITPQIDERIEVYENDVGETEAQDVQEYQEYEEMENPEMEAQEVEEIQEVQEDAEGEEAQEVQEYAEGEEALEGEEGQEYEEQGYAEEME